MTENYNAFEISPVPDPTKNEPVPEPYRGTYAMPMFATIGTPDFERSTEFWTSALGFVDFFSVPDQVVHLRRWAFQDVLLVPTDGRPAGRGPVSVSFSCALSQIETVTAECERLVPGSVDGPHHQVWNTVDLNITTPEGATVTFTAVKPLDTSSEQAASMAEHGWVHPDLQ